MSAPLAVRDMNHVVPASDMDRVSAIQAQCDWTTMNRYKKGVACFASCGTYMSRHVFLNETYV